MNEALGRLAYGFNPLYAAGIMGVGGVVGGAWYLSFSGIILGAIYALGLCGVLATILALVARMTGATFDAPVMATAGVPTAASTLAAAGNRAVSAAQAGVAAAAAPLSSAHTSAAVLVESTLPPGAPIPAEKIEATETEAQMLSAGRFSEYHLTKAKRIFEAGNFKEAAHQAAASLSHGDLPGAAELRKAALAAMK